eukprot:1147460-Pelagomonas_calceolata.AAC.6
MEEGPKFAFPLRTPPAKLAPVPTCWGRNQVPASLDELANTLDRWHEQAQQLTQLQTSASSKSKQGCRKGNWRRVPRAVKRAQVVVRTDRICQT